MRYGVVRHVSPGAVDLQAEGSTAVLRNVRVSGQVTGLAAGSRVLFDIVQGRPVVLGIAAEAVSTTSSSNVTPGETITDIVYQPVTADNPVIVGRTEGPHVGLLRGNNGDIFFEAVDTANVPFVSIGSIDYETNTAWVRIGYADQPGIRMQISLGYSEVEIHRPVEIDAECLVGTIPQRVTGGDGGATALAELTDVQITDPQDGDVLTYDAGLGKWVNQQPAPSVASVGYYPAGFWPDASV